MQNYSLFLLICIFIIIITSAKERVQDKNNDGCKQDSKNYNLTVTFSTFLFFKFFTLFMEWITNNTEIKCFLRNYFDFAISLDKAFNILNHVFF